MMDWLRKRPEVVVDAFNGYPDNNGNGVPDAFENRPSIRDILNDDQFYGADGPLSPNSFPSVMVEMERYPRCPEEGEWYISGTEIVKASADTVGILAIIIRHI